MQRLIGLTKKKAKSPVPTMMTVYMTLKKDYRRSDKNKYYYY